MKRFQTLPMTIREDPYQDVMTIHIGSEAMNDWVDHLHALVHEASDSLTVLASDRQCKLKIQKDASLSPTQRGVFVKKADQLHLAVAANELDLWLHFFSKCLQNGFGNVDHIDVDIAPAQSDRSNRSGGLLLVLKVPVFGYPVSRSTG